MKWWEASTTLHPRSSKGITHFQLTSGLLVSFSTSSSAVCPLSFKTGCLTGEPPFCGHTNLETIRAILDWPLEFKGAAWEHVSDDAKDCIRCMLERDPDKRPEARDVLAHQYPLMIWET